MGSENEMGPDIVHVIGYQHRDGPYNTMTNFAPSYLKAMQMPQNKHEQAAYDQQVQHISQYRNSKDIPRNKLYN